MSHDLKTVVTDLAQFAKAAIEDGGYKVSYHWSSTGSNLPMSLGLAALTINRSAPRANGRAHSLGEWIDVEKEPLVTAICTCLSIVLAAIGME